MSEHGLEQSAADTREDHIEREREEAWQEYVRGKRELIDEWHAELAYDHRNDPKHPRHHELVAELWDGRDKAA